MSIASQSFSVGLDLEPLTQLGDDRHGRLVQGVAEMVELGCHGFKSNTHSRPRQRVPKGPARTAGLPVSSAILRPAMSREDVELVRRVADLMAASYEAGEAAPALLEICSPELRIDASRRVFNPDVYDGREGMERLVREICDAWEDFAERTQEVIDAGATVLVLQSIVGRGRSSGVEVEADGALIFTVDDGRIERVDVFADQAEALTAAGLEQKPPSRSENVEIVRRFLTSVNDDQMELALSLVAPGAQLDWSDSQAPDSGVYQGPEQWGGWMAGRSEELADTHFEIAELVDVPPDRVLLVASMHGRGRASGVEISGLGAAVCTVREGLMTGLTMYQSREEALAALGRELPPG